MTDMERIEINAEVRRLRTAAAAPLLHRFAPLQAIALSKAIERLHSRIVDRAQREAWEAQS